MVLILKVKKLTQPKYRLIRKSTPLPQIGYPEGLQGHGASGLPMPTPAPALPFLPFTIIFPYIPVKIELLNTGDDNKNT